MNKIVWEILTELQSIWKNVPVFQFFCEVGCLKKMANVVSTFLQCAKKTQMLKWGSSNSTIAACRETQSQFLFWAKTFFVNCFGFLCFHFLKSSKKRNFFLCEVSQTKFQRTFSIRYLVVLVVHRRCCGSSL